MRSDRCVGLRTQPRCANAVATPPRGQATDIGRRGVGPRDEEEHRTRAVTVFTSNTRVSSK